MNEAVVSSIFIYPVKGFSGIRLKNSKVLTEGLEHDRKLMLVDKNGRFLSQREHAIMTLFQCSIQDGMLDIVFENDSIKLDLNEELSGLKSVSVWNSKLKAKPYSVKVNEWFSNHLGQECYLVRQDDMHTRYKRLYTPPFKTFVSFADGYPFLILSEASMDLLNSKMDKQLHIDRFRANIIIKGCEAHFEDQIMEYQIGTAIFKNIKPCARCIVTTIDQQTAQRSAEPLKTLSTYRKKANKINFGVNSICLERGIITEGDPIIATKY